MAGRPRINPDATVADGKIINFRYPADAAAELAVELLRAKVSRQTMLVAAIEEWLAGRFVVERDGTVTYPELEQLRAENARLRAELEAARGTE